MFWASKRLTRRFQYLLPNESGPTSQPGVQVTAIAEGLTFLIPAMLVENLGEGFRVIVNDGPNGCELGVFDGRVHLGYPD